jgi:hypothetical protein
MPVTGDVNDRDPDDHSYTIAWERDKQYWYDLTHDPFKDPGDLSKEVVLVDEFSRTNTLVVPVHANAYQVRDLWSQILELPRDIAMEVASSNGHEFYWSLATTKPVVPYSFVATNFRGNAEIFEGPPQFIADQLSRILGVKIPPLSKCKITSRRSHGSLIEYDGEVPQLSHKLLKTHNLAWRINNSVIAAPSPT